MPIYRKGRLPKRIPDERALIKPGVGRKRIIGKRGIRYGNENTSIEEIESALGYNIRRKIARDRKPIVVDWGCGKGRSIAEIAQQFRNARCYGFSNQFYRSWLQNKESGAMFIYSDATRFNKYFKDNSINVIYSHYGLNYADWLEYRLVDYLHEHVVPKLKKGGVLVFNLDVDMVGRKFVDDLKAWEKKAGNIKINVSPRLPHKVEYLVTVEKKK